MDPGPVPWSATKTGILLRVHLTPKSSREALEGVILQSDGKPALKVRVRAVPEDGKANSALIETIAKSLKMPRSAFSLGAGGKSRTKTVAITGDSVAIAAALQAYIDK